jgi:Flp pilus assembly protein protease CpaA
MVFWKPGSMGMSDVKFVAPAGTLVGLHLLGTLLVAIALIGGVLALVADVRHGCSATLAMGRRLRWLRFMFGSFSNPLLDRYQW